MPSRRTFITSVASLAAAGTARARVESMVTISRQPEVYHGWPTLLRRATGELLVAYSGGREAHICPFGRVD